MNRPTHTQSRIDSLAESLTNTAIGFAISLVTWIILSRAYGIPMSWSVNVQITLWFTVVSIARQYVLRRVFDGRSPWQSLKGVFNRPDQGRPDCFGNWLSGNIAAERDCHRCPFENDCLRHVSTLR